MLYCDTWHKTSKEGQENIEDEPRSGRPSSSKNDRNMEVVQAVTCETPFD